MGIQPGTFGGLPGVSAGNTTTGNIYSLGSAGSTERALGSIASSGNTFYYGVRLVNDSGTTITGFTLNYRGEQWRSTPAGTQSLTFQYSLGASGLISGTYTDVSSLKFTSPITGAAAGGALNGNLPANQVLVGPVTVNNINWLPGTSLWLRFTDLDDAGSDHGLAIDDLSFQAAGSLSNVYDPPTGYYSAADGLTGPALAAALHTIITSGGSTLLPYDSTSSTDTLTAIKSLFEDPADATKIKLTYSGDSVLKTASSWGREHLWPSSRGVPNTDNSYLDLFNIRPVYSSLTSARGAKFYDNSDLSDALYQAPAAALAAADTSKDTDSWQPSADERGDIARALFYMDVRYNGGDGSSTDLSLDNVIVNGSTMAVISTLLQWSHADPVSDEERRRNATIYSLYQHNRNPFVDNPEYVDAVFGDMVTEADDSDLDGMPTTWENAHLFDAQNAADANTDSDSDGLNNFQEYWLGSDPHDSASPSKFFVDKSYQGSVEDGSAAHPFKKIQSAIDALGANELRAIIVAPETYHERLNADGKSQVHLFGKMGAGQTIIDGDQVDRSVVQLQNFQKASFTGFTVRNALTTWYGGGLRVEAPAGKILISNNYISGNSSSNVGDGGGGIYLKTADGSRVINNFIISNSAVRGGGVLFAGGDAQFWFNTVASNSATGGNGGGLSAMQGTHPDVRDNVIWGNSGSTNPQVHQINSSYARNNVLQGAVSGSGNIGADPQFLGSGDYHIVSSSPAVGAATALPVVSDYDGDARPGGLGNRDIGADQFVVVDSEPDGLPDNWEQQIVNFSLTDDITTVAEVLPGDDFDGDGLTNLQEYQQGTSPIDYYNGTLPHLVIQSGDLQYGVSGQTIPLPLVVTITSNSTGTPLSNAPVAFTVTYGSGKLSSSQHGDKQTIQYVRTNSNGMASVYLTPKGNHLTVNQVEAKVVAGTQGASASVLFTATVIRNAGFVGDVSDVSLDDLTQVSGGGKFALGLKTDGTVWAWGANDVGQLGEQGTFDSGAPTQVTLPAGTSIRAISAGQWHGLALESNGEVWSWGDNADGQLGTGSTPATNYLPAKIADFTGVIAIAAGYEHSVAVKSDGTVWTWGSDTFGGVQGEPEWSHSVTPIEVAGVNDVVAVACGWFHTLALKGDGTVWSWGSAATPGQVSGLSGVISIACAKNHFLALKSDGTVWSWGENSDGQVGDGTTIDRNSPVQLSGLDHIVAIKAGDIHSIALKSDGTVWVWGRNETNDKAFDSVTPVQMNGVNGVASIATGDFFSIALKNDGTLWTWGNGSNGALGDGEQSDVSNLVEVPLLNDIKAISAGHYQSLAVAKSDGSVWAWGGNDRGELGNGTINNSAVPVKVSGLTGVKSVAGGRLYSVALKDNGTVWAWGWNSNGQLGNGTFSNSATTGPVQVGNLTGISAISTLGDHTLALKLPEGTVWSWGQNDQGQLGDGSTTDRSLPVLVTGLSDVKAVAAGWGHSLAVKNNGTVWAWGSNSNGQLGNGAGGNYGDIAETPTQVTGLTDVIAVAAGDGHSLALKRDGTVWSWGDNSFGELGIGSVGFTPVKTPVRVPELEGVAAISAGLFFSTAVKSDGKIWAWGMNLNNQIGDQAPWSGSGTPVLIAGSSGARTIASGGYHSLTLKPDGTIESWGFTGEGALGTNFAVFRTVGQVLGLNLHGEVPVVNFTSYPSGPIGTTLAFEGLASGPHEITKVELYSEGVKVGEASAAPFTITWFANTWGNFKFTAVATDSTGSKSYRTDPNNAFVDYDSDSDGIPDWWEQQFLTALGASSFWEVDPYGDNDNDSFTNYEEYQNGTDPSVADGDSDHDGMPDSYEQANGLDPNVDDAYTDKDGDGYPNIFELKRHSDPNDATSIPFADEIVDPSRSQISYYDNIYATLTDAGYSGNNSDYHIIRIDGGIYHDNLSIGNYGQHLLVIAKPGSVPTLSGEDGNTTLYINGDVVINGLSITHRINALGDAVDISNGVDVRLINCIIRDNHTATGSCPIQNASNSKLQLIHCTLWNNSSALGGVISNPLYGALTVTNSVLWDWPSDNSLEINNAGSIQVTSSIVRGGQAGGIDQDPLLTRLGFLKAGSPAINRSGVAFVGVTTDIRGQVRGSIPDLGADEWIDTDGDGLPDWFEALGVSDPSANADGDQLSNLAEYDFGTDPLKSDTDGDKLNDDEESTAGSDPLDPDTDNDKMPDGYEIANSLDAFVDDSLDDRDGDRLPNIVEYFHGTNPNSFGAISDPNNIVVNPPKDCVVDGSIDHSVPSAQTFKTIREAVEYCEYGSYDSSGNFIPPKDYPIITVKPGTYNGMIGLYGAPVLLRAQVGGDPVIITAGGIGSTLYITNKSVVDGFVITHSSYFSGPGVTFADAGGRLVNCIVRGNHQDYGGAGVINYSSHASIEQCTIFDNSSTNVTDGYTIVTTSPLNISNSILWDPQTAAELDGTATNVTISGSIVRNSQFGSSGADPKLTRLGYLEAGSSAIQHGGRPFGKEIYTDILNQARPASGNPDSGASQYIDDNNNGLPNWWETKFGVSSATATNGDADAFNALTEYYQGTDPNKTDTDGDALSDSDEVNIYHTDPTNGDDDDGDGLPNDYETSIIHTSPQSYDTDNDGLTDSFETANNLDPNTWNSPNADSDGDGLSDGDEQAYGTRANDASGGSGDSDGDGVSDSDEADNGTNPNDPADGGQSPPPSDIYSATFKIGSGEFDGDSESDFQGYKMTVTEIKADGSRSVLFTHYSNGASSTAAVKTRKLRVDRAYSIEISPLQPGGSAEKDFDYHASIDLSDPNIATIFDPFPAGPNILGSFEQDQEQGEPFPQAGKKAYIVGGKIKLTAGDGISLIERIRLGHDLRFSENDLLVLPRSVGDMSLSFQGVIPSEMLPYVNWRVRRNPEDTVSAPTPSYIVDSGNKLTATVSTNGVGSFNLMFGVDTNGNQQIDDNEALAAMNTALIGGEILSSTIVTLTPPGNICKTNETTSTANLFLTIGDPNHPAMSATASLQLNGGGADKKLGVHKIHPGYLQNETAFSTTVTYPDGHTGQGQLLTTGSALDATGGGASADYLSSSSSSYDDASRIATVTAKDYTGTNVQKNFSGSAATEQADHAQQTADGNHFVTWLAMYSDDGQFLYGLTGKYQWRDDAKFFFHGFVDLGVGPKYPDWDERFAGSYGDTVISTAGFPRSATDENAVIVPPSAAPSHHITYQ
jgi:alpha-tubulin suppressor-like RCC1 family protein/endonuclease I